MSKKSVLIALPQQAQQAPAVADMEADRWVQVESHHTLRPGGGVIDLTADRSPVELAWLIWFFPAMATWHWMANARDRSFYPRPR